METELISVIVPVYNVERYLRRCVDSILHQTYQDLEVLLVDDEAERVDLTENDLVFVTLSLIHI